VLMNHHSNHRCSYTWLGSD